MAERINELKVLIRGAASLAHRPSFALLPKGRRNSSPHTRSDPGGCFIAAFKCTTAMQAGDIDPRLERGYCYEISDKARAIGGGVLEAILGASIDLKLPSD